jgi:hypothetical protein
MKYGRRLKGPVMLTPREFNKTVNGDGIGFKTTEAKQMMRIPLQAEAQHIELMGDTGAGKTTLIMQILRQIQGRGHAAIVYDPACEFIQRFYDAKRGDIVLNPLDDRCPYWGPSEELRRKAEAKAISASLYQPTSDKKGEFFTETPQKIFAHLLTKGPTPEQLVAWLSNPAEIDQRVRGTEMEAMIAKGAQQQRNGVLASLGLVADSLRMLPTREQAGDRTWSATEWSENRAGWIFITSSATEREALRPLHSLWIDLLVKYTTEAIVSEGIEKGETRTVCAQADCPVHHPKKQTSTHEPKWNAEEQKRRREEALAQATGLRTLAAIVAAVPVRLMKRDLLFVVERLAALLDERSLEIVARQRGIKKAKDSDSIGKLFTAYLRHSEESALGGLLVEITILHAATKQNAAQVLRDATTAYKVDVDAISLKVKQEFAAKEKAKLAPKPAAKAMPPKAKKAA